MATRESDEVKTLDTLRRRLLTISTNLHHFRDTIANPQVILPPWPLILSTCQNLATNLNDLQAFLLNNKAFENLELHIPGYDVPRFLNVAHAHPTNAFPPSQESILGMLLVKKLAPAVEEWVDDAVKVAVEANEQAAQEENGALSGDQLQELWIDMVVETQNAATHMDDAPQDGDDEGDEEDGDDDDEEDEEEMEDAAVKKGEEAPAVPLVPMMKLEDVLRFMSTGSAR